METTTLDPFTLRPLPIFMPWALAFLLSNTYRLTTTSYISSRFGIKTQNRLLAFHACGFEACQIAILCSGIWNILSWLPSLPAETHRFSALDIAHLASASIFIHYAAILVVDVFESADTLELLCQGHTLLLTRTILWPMIVKRLAAMAGVGYGLRLPEHGPVALMVRDSFMLAAMPKSILLQRSGKHKESFDHAKAFLSVPSKSIARRFSFPDEMLNTRPLAVEDSRLAQTRPAISELAETAHRSTSTNSTHTNSESSPLPSSDASSITITLPPSYSPPTTPTTPPLTAAQNADLLALAREVCGEKYFAPGTDPRSESNERVKEPPIPRSDTRVRTLVKGIEARHSISGSLTPAREQKRAEVGTRTEAKKVRWRPAGGRGGM